MKNSHHHPHSKAFLRAALLMLTLAITAIPAATGRAQDGPRFTPVSELPEQFRDLLTCAESGKAQCQYELGLIWEGHFDSGVWNEHEAVHWWMKAAYQGFVPAMRMYGGQLCFDQELVTQTDGTVEFRAKSGDGEMIEGLAWILLARDYSLTEHDIDFCLTRYRDDMPKKQRKNYLERAVARAKALEFEIGYQDS